MSEAGALRGLLLRVMGVWVMSAGLLWPVRGVLVDMLRLPLTWFGTPEIAWLAVGFSEVFVLDIKLVLGVAVAVAAPYALFEIYRFMAPGLYAAERRVARRVVVVAPLISLVGAAMAWAFLAPSAAVFLLGFGHKGLTVMPRLADYLGLVLGMGVGAVLLLHAPLVALMLVQAGFVRVATLQRGRKWVVLCVLVVAAFVTPPDPLSMLLLAVPVLLWWEICLFLGRRA